MQGGNSGKLAATHSLPKIREPIAELASPRRRAEIKAARCKTGKERHARGTAIQVEVSEENRQTYPQPRSTLRKSRPQGQRRVARRRPELAHQVETASTFVDSVQDALLDDLTR